MNIDNKQTGKTDVVNDIRERIQKASSSDPVSEESFDLDHVYSILKQLVTKYDIKYDPDHPVPSDEALADKVFDAAVEFFVECGVYFQNSRTIIRFNREETLQAVADYDGECHFGRGKEARVFRARKPDSNTHPWCHVGSGIVASSEEIASQIVYGNACIEQADSMSVNALDRIEGEPIVTGEPSEITGAIRSIEIARNAINRAGREGLAIINGIATAGSSHATIEAAKVVFGPHSGDAVIVGTLAEFKTNQEMIDKVEYCLNSDTRIVLASAPMLGGYGGGPEATAILNTAYVFLGMLIYRCDYYLSLPLHIQYSCSTTRDVVWAMALSGQALSRNTNVPTLALGYIAGGPMTESFFYESTAFIAASIASGVSTQTPHPARAVLPDYVTPLEMKTTTELALACAGMTRRQADQVVKSLLAKYENGLAAASVGKSYTECFDPDTAVPRDEYLDFVEKIKRDLIEMGIPQF